MSTLAEHSPMSIPGPRFQTACGVRGKNQQTLTVEVPGEPEQLLGRKALSATGQPQVTRLVAYSKAYHSSDSPACARRPGLQITADNFAEEDAKNERGHAEPHAHVREGTGYNP